MLGGKSGMEEPVDNVCQDHVLFMAPGMGSFSEKEACPCVEGEICLGPGSAREFGKASRRLE